MIRYIPMTHKRVLKSTEVVQYPHYGISSLLKCSGLLFFGRIEVLGICFTVVVTLKKSTVQEWLTPIAIRESMRQ